MLIPHSLRVGLVCDLLLCVGLTTLAICARTYVKLRISKGFLSEDCELSPIWNGDIENYVLKQSRLCSRWLRMFIVELSLEQNTDVLWPSWVFYLFLDLSSWLERVLSVPKKEPTWVCTSFWTPTSIDVQRWPSVWVAFCGCKASVYAHYCLRQNIDSTAICHYFRGAPKEPFPLRYTHSYLGQHDFLYCRGFTLPIRSKYYI